MSRMNLNGDNKVSKEKRKSNIWRNNGWRTSETKERQLRVKKLSKSSGEQNCTYAHCNETVETHRHKESLNSSIRKEMGQETKQCLQKSNNTLTTDFSIETVEAKALKNYIWEVLEENNWQSRILYYMQWNAIQNWRL